jgi:hypothetical protein
MKILTALLALFTSAAASASDSAPVASPSYKLQVGKPEAFEARSPDGRYSVVFEDDGDTGFFYALDYSNKENNPIQEAMSIYDVKNVTDREKPSVVVLVWTADSRQAALFINSYPHAVFDFAKKRGYSRRNFPKPGKWGTDFKWDDTAIDAFKKKNGG